MALAHQKFREIVFLLLYSYDLGKGADEEVIPLVMTELAVTRRSVKEAQHRMCEVLKLRSEIDSLIEKISKSYDFDRIQSVEKNVLRLGLYEMMHDDEIPPKVAIAEAMRLTRKFATPEASSFVNAVMDKAYRMTLGQSLDDKALDESVNALEESEKITRQISEDSATFVHEPDSTLPKE